MAYENEWLPGGVVQLSLKAQVSLAILYCIWADLPFPFAKQCV